MEQENRFWCAVREPDLSENKGTTFPYLTLSCSPSSQLVHLICQERGHLPAWSCSSAYHVAHLSCLIPAVGAPVLLCPASWSWLGPGVGESQSSRGGVVSSC